MDNPFMALASFAMGVIAFFLAEMIKRYYSGSQVPKDMAKWHTDVEIVCCDIVRARIYVAETERRLVELVGEVPVDFNPALFAAPAMAKAVEDALVAKAHQDGIFPERRFDKPEPLPDNVVNLDSHEWVAGQLLKKVGS